MRDFKLPLNYYDPPEWQCFECSGDEESCQCNQCEECEQEIEQCECLTKGNDEKWHTK